MFSRLAFLLTTGCLLLAQDPAARVERLGEGGREVLVLGLEAPGFEKLKPTQRKQAYYLSRAAIAGMDIAYFQAHRYAWDIKELFELLYEHRALLEPSVASAVEDYLKLVWVNHGQYRHYQATKFTPRNLTYRQVERALRTLRGKKIRPTFRKGVNLAVLRPHIFDPKVEPLQVNQSPGVDPVKASASGLYDPGLTLKAIQALPKEDQGRLNVRYARKKGKAVPEVFKIKGLHGEQLAHVAYWLKKASDYVDHEVVEVEKEGVKKPRLVPNPTQHKAFQELIAYYQTGDEARFRDHSIAWLKVMAPVDWLNGYVETYKDPRGVIGTFEANVSFRADAEVLDRLSQSALYFESRMPWKDAWKRPKVDPPVAMVVNLLTATGGAGPISPAAYNLPNYNDIRRDHGSKNVMLMNVMNAGSPDQKEQLLKTLYLPEDQALVRQHGAQARLWLVYLHEILGHGSGQPDPSLKGEDPDRLLGAVASAHEECRADAVALYQFLDPRIVELGAVSAADHAAVAKAMFLTTLTGALRVQGELEGAEVRQAHERAETLILNYLMEAGQDRGVTLTVVDGKHYVQVTDLDKARQGVGELLVKLQTFKSMGDGEGASALFQTYGTRINPAWQKDLKARLSGLQRSLETAFVFPKLVPVVEEKDGRTLLKDVTLTHTETLAEQMLRFKRWSRSRELAPK